MAKRKDKREYQFQYVVRAIVGINVEAETEDEALAKATKRQRGALFADDIEVIDERDDYSGFCDLTAWKIMDE